MSEDPQGREVGRITGEDDREAILYVGRGTVTLRIPDGGEVTFGLAQQEEFGQHFVTASWQSGWEAGWRASAAEGEP